MWTALSCLVCSITLLDLPQALAPPPLEVPPPDIVDRLTLNGSVPLEYYYVDDSNKGMGTHYKFPCDDIVTLIQQAERFLGKALSMPIPRAPVVISSSVTWLTQLTDIWLANALKKYPVTGLHVVVFGSTSPWYESLLLAAGAAHVTTVEYNKLTYNHPNISTLLLSNLNKEELHFDAAFSFTSFDHDGLGRYGDPINPDGDLEAMKTVQSVLNEQGHLFLTVPIGPDVIVWNLHRRYGNARLPLLLEGWEQVDCFGWSEELLTQQSHCTIAYEPVFVLRNTKKKNNS